jgi:hypothetical protein
VSSPESAEVIVPLGGDGFMLETLHRFLSLGRLPALAHPPEMTARDEHGGHRRALAFNDPHHPVDADPQSRQPCRHSPPV